MTSQAVLEVKHLNKSFGMQPVIRDLSLMLYPGDRVALYAPSGAGKTTLLRILTGLESPDSGSFILRDPAPVTIFQEPRLFPFLSVEENIFLPFRAQRKPITQNIRRQYEEWLDVCELAPFKDHFPREISGGMKQKVALIRGLLGSPRFVMMDEPFQSIGAEAKLAIIQHMLHSNPQITLLFITHIREEVPWLAQQVIVFQRPCLHDAIQLQAEAFGHSAVPETHFLSSYLGNLAH